MTSGGMGSNTTSGFYSNNHLTSKPNPLMNAFSAGSSADISQQNIELGVGKLTTQQSKGTISKNNGFMMAVASENEDIYGNSTAAGNSKP